MAGEIVLVVEDDPTMLRVLGDNLKFRGYCVKTAMDGETGYEAALVEKPDLILLDVMLPKVNGYEVCRLLRKENIKVPIIMLTAKSDESDVVLGLNIGADEYVTKPFSMKTLLARVNAMLRRARSEDETMYRFGPYALDLISRRLLKGKEAITLTPREFSMLEYFVARTGRALTRNDILAGVWGHQVIVTPRSVDRCVTTLRNKIEPDPRQPIYLQTVREIGYRFAAPDDQAD